MACALAAADGVTRALSAQVPGEVRGQVTDRTTALPIAGAVVEVTGRPTTVRTEADGSYEVRGLEPRSYVVRARALGYAPGEARVEVENGRAAVLDISLEPAAVSLAAVTVTGARDSAQLDATTYDRAAIERSGRRDLGELLQSTPGLVITQSGGPGAPSRVSIRGSGANEVLVIVDGVVVNSPITGEADLSRIPLEAVESVVVQTGARSARYGGRALAGVIEIRTRRATGEMSAMLRSGAWGERGASITLGDTRSVGAMQMGASLTGDYSRITGDFEYEVPSVRGGGRARRANSDVTSRAILGSVSVLDSDSGALSATLRGSWQKLERGLAGSIVQPSLTGRERQHRGDAGIDATLKRGAIAWTNSVDLTRERASYVDPSPPFGIRYDDAITANAFTANSELTLGAGGMLGGSLGGELRTLRISSSTLEADAPTYQRNLGAFGGLRLSRELERLDATLLIDLGARVDRNTLSDGSTTSARAVASVSRGRVTTSLSLGSAYAPPSLADQFFHEGVLARPNPDLRAERTRGDLEGRIAVRAVPAGALLLSAEAAAFRADIDGMILWLPDFRFVWSPSNYLVKRSGWELTGAAALPGASLELDATLGRASVAYGGPVLRGQVAYRPRTTAAIKGAWEPGAVRVELSSRYAGARRTVPGSELNTLDPYWRTDLRVTTAREWGNGKWRVDGTVGVDNLFDDDATMLVDYPFPSRSWSVTLRVRRARPGHVR